MPAACLAEYLALTYAIEARNPYTYRHSLSVAHLSTLFGMYLGLDRKLIDNLHSGSLLHDVGKIGIPDAVLLKPAGLSAEETIIVRRHPELGHRIVQPLELDEDVQGIILHHHERWDGTGYPHGLAGGAIPFLARLVALADAFDAITTNRPYRPSYTANAALAEILAQAGRQFDPELALKFVKYIRDGQKSGVYRKILLKKHTMSPAARIR